MSEELDKIILDLQNERSILYGKIRKGIPLILAHKAKLYSGQLNDLNKRIVDIEQEKLLNNLCAQDLNKETIEYKSTEDGSYKSIDISTLKSKTDNARRRILADVPVGKLNLFSATDQCSNSSRNLVFRHGISDEGADTIYPSWDNLQEQNKSYYEIIQKRNVLKGFITFINDNITQLDQAITYTITGRSVSYNSNTKTTSTLDHRIYLLRESLEKLRANVLGSSRAIIRTNIAQFVQSFANNWRLYTEQYLNFSLLGPPGSGKTTIATYLGDVFKNLGILVRGHVTVESRATIVGQYVGQTADKVRNILVDNLESIVFIDEAYAIAQGSSKELDPYGIEALNEIVGFLDKNRGQICIISAGYKKQMDEFWFKPNPGLRRRTPYIWFLEDYKSDELFEIMKHTAHIKAYNFAIFNNDVQEFILDNKLETETAILANKQVGYFINLILKFFDKDKFFENQAGDMETLTSTIVNKYFLDDSRLDLNDIKNIFSSFLTNRNILLGKNVDINAVLTDLENQAIKEEPDIKLEVRGRSKDRSDERKYLEIDQDEGTERKVVKILADDSRITYPSVKAAADAAGIKPGSMRERIRLKTIIKGSRWIWL